MLALELPVNVQKRQLSVNVQKSFKIWVLTLDRTVSLKMCNQNFENWEGIYKSQNGNAILIHMGRKEWIDCVVGYVTVHWLMYLIHLDIL